MRLECQSLKVRETVRRSFVTDLTEFRHRCILVGGWSCALCRTAAAVSEPATTTTRLDTRGEQCGQGPRLHGRAANSLQTRPSSALTLPRDLAAAVQVVCNPKNPFLYTVTLVKPHNLVCMQQFLFGRPPACGEIEIIQHSSLCRQREAHFSNTSSACASRAEPTSART